MAAMVIFFDLVGTLFTLDRVRHAFRAHGVPEDLLPFWFARMLHVSMASTLSGRYTPFLGAAESALRQALAFRDLGADAVPDTLRALQTLEPWPDTRPCLAALAAAGHRLVALSNVGIEMQRSLIGGGGLADFFSAMLSSDEAGRCKPHPAPYRMALDRLQVPAAGACMVAAHAWDVQGAAAVGLRTVWVSRIEKAWSFPGEPPDAVVASLSEVRAAIDAMAR